MWEQIRSNRRRSLFVLAGMGALLVAMGLALGVMVAGEGGLLLGGALALAIWLVMWGITVSQGDNIMLRMAGAKKIEKRDHPTLVNVVEEMSIAAGLGHRPEIYIVDDRAANAFATGRKLENSAVAVTTGLLASLNREELQGVVAHEIGHIKNRDVALMTTAGIMMGTIVLLAEMGRRILWYGGGFRSRSSSKKGGGQAAVMVAAIILMVLAPLLAQLIYLALSRRREYLADASGAMFTRYPEGLASALEKIGGIKEPQADKSRVTAPMYIIQPFLGKTQRNLKSAFATHPPLIERIKILREMGGGAGLSAYDAAYRKVTKGKPLAGAASLTGAEEISVQAPSSVDPSSSAERTRQASDAFLAASGYQRRSCGDCGATVKIPPSLKRKVSQCPRCSGQLK
ncbi:MAG: M48 family metallopeptidase [Planctomycetota bacterium]|nr:M48 family metallopeptidase [Planctomycetota bacterium]